MIIQLQPSKALRYYFWLSHLAAMLVVFVLPIALEYRCLFILLLSISACYYLLPQGYGKKNTPLVLQRKQEGQWRIEYSDGRQQDELKLVSSMVTLPFIIMNFQQKSRYRYIRLLLLRDMVDKELMRLLRIELRHGCQE